MGEKERFSQKQTYCRGRKFLIGSMAARISQVLGLRFNSRLSNPAQKSLTPCWVIKLTPKKHALVNWPPLSSPLLPSPVLVLCVILLPLTSTLLPFPLSLLVLVNHFWLPKYTPSNSQSHKISTGVGKQGRPHGLINIA